MMMMMKTILITPGTAEIVFTDGLVWCQAPIGYALSLMLGIIEITHLVILFIIIVVNIIKIIININIKQCTIDTEDIIFLFLQVEYFSPFSSLSFIILIYHYHSLSLLSGGIFFANKMRTKGYVTMLDPLQVSLCKNE